MPECVGDSRGSSKNRKIHSKHVGHQSQPSQSRAGGRERCRSSLGLPRAAGRASLSPCPTQPALCPPRTTVFIVSLSAPAMASCWGTRWVTALLPHGAQSSRLFFTPELRGQRAKPAQKSPERTSDSCFLPNVKVEIQGDTESHSQAGPEQKWGLPCPSESGSHGAWHANLPVAQIKDERRKLTCSGHTYYVQCQQGRQGKRSYCIQRQLQAPLLFKGCLANSQAQPPSFSNTEYFP